MGRLSTFERLRVIEIYSKFNKFGFGNKCKAVSQYAKEKGIGISESGVRLIMEKWETTSILNNSVVNVIPHNVKYWSRNAS